MSRINDVGEEPNAFVEIDECDDIRRCVLELGVHRSAHDAKARDASGAARVAPCRCRAAMRTDGAYGPVETRTRCTVGQREMLFACCLPIAGRGAAGSRPR